jgi:ectoine hydroxylase-related dioxygenase (phytanoyl-CoA dioxygenase family)
MSQATPTFKVVPDQSELDQMQRDLQFHPARNEHPRRLTQDQIRNFNERGFIRPISIFSATEINDIRNYFDHLLERVIAEGGNSYSISSAHLKHGRVYDILSDRRIVDCVSDLLGENVIGWGSHFFCKMPHDGKSVAWHQDASYWPLSPSKAATVWLAIDDADCENACMRFIAGSHHVGHLTYRPSSPEDHNVLNQSVDNPEQYGEIVDDVLAAGQISIHSDLLLHGSVANDSDRRRCGLTIRYAAADVRAAMEWNQKGVWVRGTDSTGHWANRPRPEQD